MRSAESRKQPRLQPIGTERNNKKQQIMNSSTLSAPTSAPSSQNLTSNPNMMINLQQGMGNLPAWPLSHGTFLRRRLRCRTCIKNYFKIFTFHRQHLACLEVRRPYRHKIPLTWWSRIVLFHPTLLRSTWNPVSVATPCRITCHLFSIRLQTWW